MFHGRLNVAFLLLTEVQIYPIDVVKTQFQKRQLETGRAQVTRPDIKFFQPGSYRGKPIEESCARTPADKNRPWSQCRTLCAYQHDLLLLIRADQEAHQQRRRHIIEFLGNVHVEARRHKGNGGSLIYARNDCA
jgi:hypothetical protein